MHSLSLRIHSAALLVLVNTLLCFTVGVRCMPTLYRRHQPAPSATEPFKVRTTGPNYAGIITHSPATVQKALFGVDRPAPQHLPLSGLWTRGNLQASTVTALDNFLNANDKAGSYWYTLTILGLGLNEHPDGLWKFFVKVDLAVTTEKDARGHTKLPQLTISYKQPSPNEANAYLFSEMHDMYELTEQDILETIESDEPSVGVMEFISSRVSRMPGFSHKHVGMEEFELEVARTTKDTKLNDGNDF